MKIYATHALESTDRSFHKVVHLKYNNKLTSGTCYFSGG